MGREERWSRLLDVITADGRVEIEAAARRFDVSAATVRRDLDELAAQHLVVRTRGGAVAHAVTYELPLRYKTARRADEKRSIGATAAALADPGGVIGLNGGTTTTEVARALVAASETIDVDPAYTVVTNALNIAHELALRPQVKLVVTGGVVRPASYELVGPLADPILDQLALDVCFLGVDGIAARHGASTANESEAAVNRAMAAAARRVVVVADATKLGRTSFARILPVRRVDTLVTSADADADDVATLREAGVEVIVA